jgi:hypothetical protein
MIGAGVGITPLRALAEELGGRDDNGADVVLLHRYRDEPLFADELATLTRYGRARTLPLPGPHIDAVFSRCRPDTVISRLGRGEFTETECPAEVHEVLALAAPPTAPPAARRPPHQRRRRRRRQGLGRRPRRRCAAERDVATARAEQRPDVLDEIQRGVALRANRTDGDDGASHDKHVEPASQATAGSR